MSDFVIQIDVCNFFDLIFYNVYKYTINLTMSIINIDMAFVENVYGRKLGIIKGVNQ